MLHGFKIESHNVEFDRSSSDLKTAYFVKGYVFPDKE